MMCSNAMTYNGPETAYYSLAKQLHSNGLQIIAKVSTCSLPEQLLALVCILIACLLTGWSDFYCESLLESIYWYLFFLKVYIDDLYHINFIYHTSLILYGFLTCTKWVWSI